MKRRNNRKLPKLNRQFSIVNFQSGFTLIEICIAILILGVGLISMLTIFPIGVDSVKKVTQYSNAAVLVESAISELIEKNIFTDTDIMGTLTASQTYTYTDAYPLNLKDQDRLFQDSFGITTHAQYSWQGNLKSIIGTNDNLVRAQIAIFRNFNSSQFGAGTADFTNGIDTVSYTPPLPAGLTSKDYIREDNDDNSDKFWYRIDSIGTSTSTITLEAPFLGTGGTGLTFSTTDDIIDIYETMFSKR
ncbi:MAG: type II secretion system GspH family protein [Candidatus Scalindua rubra]|nr:type II secretion system GspH family protein [Candidatus Scalindua rubra]